MAWESALITSSQLLPLLPVVQDRRAIRWGNHAPCSLTPVSEGPPAHWPLTRPSLGSWAGPLVHGPVPLPGVPLCLPAGSSICAEPLRNWGWPGEGV